MKIKLDENLGSRGADLLRQSGHDVLTVFDQGLAGADDPIIAEVCRVESRCLVTLDLGFGNPLVYRPGDYAGIAVLRLPPQVTPTDLIDAIRTLIGGLAQRSIEGKLWTVQRGRIREYQPPSDEDYSP